MGRMEKNSLIFMLIFWTIVAANKLEPYHMNWQFVVVLPSLSCVYTKHSYPAVSLAVNHHACKFNPWNFIVSYMIHLHAYV